MCRISQTGTIGAKTVVQELKRQFFDVERIVKIAGLELRSINNADGWIPFIKYAALLEITADETDDDYFGIHLVDKFDPRDLGPLGYIGLSSGTLGEALLNLERYLAITTEASRIKISIFDDLVHINFRHAETSFHRYRQVNEFMAGKFIRTYQFFTGCKITPAAVKFVHRYDGNVQEHQKVLGCPVTFGEKQFQIILNRSDLATPIGSADHRLLRILTTYGDELLQKSAIGKPEHIIKLEHLIVDLLPKGKAKAKIVAAELGVTERTLIRNLAKSDTSFTEIHNRLRHELALRYLGQPELNLTQVSFLLGYANQSAFSAAFKRTTGIAPREMRQ